MRREGKGQCTKKGRKGQCTKREGRGSCKRCRKSEGERREGEKEEREVEYRTVDSKPFIQIFAFWQNDSRAHITTAQSSLSIFRKLVTLALIWVLLQRLESGIFVRRAGVKRKENKRQ
jgi:hypothetical protein